MMTTIDLKNILIHRIAGIDDKSFLSAINTIVEVKSESTIYKTTQEQQRRIEEACMQISNGKIFTNQQVEIEIDKWLKEK
jgi:hypothetical protein